VRQGVFAYVRAGQVDPNRVKEGSGYLVDTRQAEIGTEIAPADIDLDNAFIVLPQAIEPAGGAAPVPAGTAPGLSETGDAPTDTGVASGGSGEGGTTGPGLPPQQTRVRLAMRLTRQQLYATVNALSNLADAAGAIRVSIEAFKADGFDPNWLRNAVLEPLDEADVDMEEFGK
jgi:hypothetical protein